MSEKMVILVTDVCLPALCTDNRPISKRVTGMKGDGKKVNAHSDASRVDWCPQRRTIPFTHCITSCWSAGPRALLPAMLGYRSCQPNHPREESALTNPVQLIHTAQQSCTSGACKRWAWGWTENQSSVGSDKQPCFGVPRVGERCWSATRGLWEGQIFKAALSMPSEDTCPSNVLAFHSAKQKDHSPTVKWSSDNLAKG